MATIISHSPAETEASAEPFARAARAGTVLGLVGDLGSGKTQFVRGLARALGVTTPVHSPTFALLHIYTGGRLPLFHMDFYRLESSNQILAAGLDQYLASEGVAVVEWWDRWELKDPPGLIRITFATIHATEHRIHYADPGT